MTQPSHTVNGEYLDFHVSHEPPNFQTQQARLKDILSFFRSFTSRHDETHVYSLSVRTKKQSTEDVCLKLEEVLAEDARLCI